MAKQLRPQTSILEVPGQSPSPAVASLGKVLYPHSLVYWKRLEAISPVYRRVIPYPCKSYICFHWQLQPIQFCDSAFPMANMDQCEPNLTVHHVCELVLRHDYNIVWRLVLRCMLTRWEGFGKICFLILIQCGPLSWYTVYLKAILHMKCDFVNSFAKWNDLAHILTQRSYLNEIPPNPTNLVFPLNRYSVSSEQNISFNMFEDSK